MVCRYSNIYLSLAIILAMSLTGCARVDTLPQLEIEVLDETGKPVAGAYVGLFQSIEEWKKLANPVQTWRRTDLNGRVVFVDLRESDYYFYVRSADKDNSIGEVSTTEPLRINQRSIVGVVIR